jgi:deazaflavin-dependent oxidoreductase (nitroreductase family)
MDRTHSPKGLLRLLLRAPVWLYRLGLGWLLGKRFILLTHIGRKTGRPRHTVLEVVRYEPSTGQVVVASAWGEKAHWFRNILAQPRVQVQHGRRRFAAMAHCLTPLEAERALAEYAAQHPTAFKILVDTLGGVKFQDPAEACRALAQEIPLVALQPIQEGG